MIRGLSVDDREIKDLSMQVNADPNKFGDGS